MSTDRQARVPAAGTRQPGDLTERLAAARALAGSGERGAAARRLREIAGQLVEAGRAAESLEVLREVVQLDPGDIPSRFRLARAALDADDVAGARAILPRSLAGRHPSLLTMISEIELRAGELDEARGILGAALASGRASRADIAEMAWTLCPDVPEAASACVDVIVEHAVAARDWAFAAGVLRELAVRVPGRVATLAKLLRVATDGRLDEVAEAARAALGDAHGEAGATQGARESAEDLLERDPGDQGHRARLGRPPVLAAAPPDASPDPQPLQSRRGRAGSRRTRAARPAGDGLRSVRADTTIDIHEEAGAGPGSHGVGQADHEAPARREGPVRAAASRSSSARPRPGEGFDEFRQAVDRETSLETATRQYKIALAYREAGMDDAALAALEVAVQAAPFRFEAAALLGRISLGRGRIDQAVHWLARAAEAPAPSFEDARSVVYELACALETAGQPARALALFKNLQTHAGDYRDVVRRVDRLSRV